VQPYYSGRKFQKEDYDSDEDSVFGSFNPNLNTKDNTSSSNLLNFNKNESAFETLSKKTSHL
jgi:hypothetical protein